MRPNVSKALCVWNAPHTDSLTFEKCLCFIFQIKLKMKLQPLLVYTAR